MLGFAYGTDENAGDLEVVRLVGSCQSSKLTRGRKWSGDISITSLRKGGYNSSGCGLPRESTKAFTLTAQPPQVAWSERQTIIIQGTDKVNTQARQTLASAPVDLARQPKAWSPSAQAEVAGKWWPVTCCPVHPAPPSLSKYWTFRLCFLILAEFKAPRKRAFVWRLAFLLEAETGRKGNSSKPQSLIGRQEGGTVPWHSLCLRPLLGPSSLPQS